LTGNFWKPDKNFGERIEKKLPKTKPHQELISFNNSTCEALSKITKNSVFLRDKAFKIFFEKK